MCARVFPGIKARFVFAFKWLSSGHLQLLRGLLDLLRSSIAQMLCCPLPQTLPTRAHPSPPSSNPTGPGFRARPLDSPAFLPPLLFPTSKPAFQMDNHVRQLHQQGRSARLRKSAEQPFQSSWASFLCLCGSWIKP